MEQEAAGEQVIAVAYDQLWLVARSCLARHGPEGSTL